LKYGASEPLGFMNGDSSKLLPTSGSGSVLGLDVAEEIS